MNFKFEVQIEFRPGGGGGGCRATPSEINNIHNFMYLIVTCGGHYRDMRE